MPLRYTKAPDFDPQEPEYVVVNDGVALGTVYRLRHAAVGSGTAREIRSGAVTKWHREGTGTRTFHEVI